MPTITFSCSSCGQVLRTGADKAGKKAKCVKCGKILTIPAPDEVEAEPAPRETGVKAGKPKSPPPLPSEAEERPRRRSEDEDDGAPPRKRRRDEEEDEDRPRRRVRDEDEDDERPRRRRDEDEDDDDELRSKRRRDDDDDEDDLDDDRPRSQGMPKRARWAKVKVGLLLTFISACILIGYGGLSALGAIIAYIGLLARSMSMLDVAGVLGKITVVLGVLLQFPAVVGYIFGVFSPPKNKALAFAITCIALGLINLGLKIFGLIAVFNARGGGAQIIGGGLAGLPDFGIRTAAAAVIVAVLVILLLASEWIIYPLFLRSVALNVKDRYLAGGALTSLFFACGVVALQVLMVILVVSMMSGGFGRPSEAMGHIVMILGIITYGVLTAFAVIYMRAQSHTRAAIDART